MLHPVVVRPREDGFELVVGERRYRACRMLGWERIPAIVREMSDGEIAEIALIENLQREGLTFFEEAEGYKRLLDEFGLTQEELAKRLGKSQSSVANKLRLLRFEAPVERLISREMLSDGTRGRFCGWKNGRPVGGLGHDHQKGAERAGYGAADRGDALRAAADGKEEASDAADQGSLQGLPAPPEQRKSWSTK